MSEDKEQTKSFEQLVEEKAGCCEFAWRGFIRLYEEGEEKCQCKDCKLMDEILSSSDCTDELTRVNTAIWSKPIPPVVRNAFGRKSTPSLKDENKQSRD